MKFRIKNILIVIVVAFCFLCSSDIFAEEGDFFFAPEFGWSHFFADSIEEGIYTGAHLAYDTSDNLSIELIFFYGDNNGTGNNSDLRYVLGGGGVSYKWFVGKFKPSAFAGATVAGIDFSDTGAIFKGGLYLGTGLEYYLNKVVSVGITFKYFPLIKSADITQLGFRFGFEL